MTTAFSEIDPIFRCLCACTKSMPNDMNFLWLLMRTSHIILAKPSLVEGLIELSDRYLSIPDEMRKLQQKSDLGPEESRFVITDEDMYPLLQQQHDYLAAVTLRFIDECNSLGSDITSGKIPQSG